MIDNSLGKCTFCGAEILYKSSVTLVKCSACGENVAIAAFLNEQVRLEKAMQEAEEAKAALKMQSSIIGSEESGALDSLQLHLLHTCRLSL